MIDDPQDEALRTLAADYHQPPPVPREEIWARIQAERATARPAAPVVELRPRTWRSSPGLRALAWVTGVAALVAVGIGLGRLSLPGAAANPPVAAAVDPQPDGGDRAQAVLAVAVRQYLSQTETLLTGLRTGEQADFAAVARDLLTMTRLLLDSPGLTDPMTRDLLSDLELVLAQVVVLPEDGDAARERSLITAGMEHHNLMPRLRTAIPAGSPGGIQGEL